MSRARAAGLLVVGFVLAWVLPWHELPAGLAADLPLATVLLITARRPDVSSAFLATATGLLLDATSSSPFGLHGMTLGAAAGTAIWLTARLDLHLLPGVALLFLGGVTAARVVEMVASVSARHAPTPLSLDLGRVLVTSCAGIVLWWLNGPYRLAEEM